MKLFKASPEEWSTLAKNAHLATFKEYRFPEFNRHSFVLVCADYDELFAFSTIIEIDQDTAYMQHGGSMPNIRGTVSSKRCYRMMIEWLKRNYKRISTRIENTNVAMLKFALSEGLIVDGCFCYEREVYLSLGWGF